MRHGRVAAALLAALACAPAARAAGGCDLDELVGYQLLAGRTVDGYIEEGKQHRGFKGCQLGWTIVFTDNTGVRCKSAGWQDLDVPKAYLFARSKDDMKMCVVDELYDVAPLR
jgi:hypothetical protein